MNETEIQDLMIEANDAQKTKDFDDYRTAVAHNAVGQSQVAVTLDPVWVSSSKIMYQHKHGKAFEGTDEEAARFGFEYTTNANLPYSDTETSWMGSPFNKWMADMMDFDDASPAVQTAMTYLRHQYDEIGPINSGLNKIATDANHDNTGQFVSPLEWAGQYHNKKTLGDASKAFMRMVAADHVLDGLDEKELAEITAGTNAMVEGVTNQLGIDYYDPRPGMAELRQDVRNIPKNARNFLTGVFQGVVGGFRDAGQGVLDLGHDLEQSLPEGMQGPKLVWGRGEGLELIWPDDPDYGDLTVTIPDVPHGGGAQEALRGITQFMAVFGTAGGLIKLRGALRVGRDVTAGATADATFDPELGNVSTLLRELDVDNAVTRFLDSKVGEDALAEERLRARLVSAAAEGAILGLMIEPLMKTFVHIKRNGLQGTVKDLIVAAEDMIPAPGQLNMGIGPSGKKKIKTVLSFPKSDTEARVGRIVKRNQAAADGKPIPGGPKNKRTVIKAPEGSGLPDFVTGDITFDDWIARTEALSSPADIAKHSKWYSELRGHFLKWSDSPEEADKLMRAWLVANQNTDVGKAMANALSQREQFARGVPIDEMIAGGLPNATGAARSVLLGEEIAGGVGQKISDFVDSAEGSSTRSWMGGDERGGAPFVVDIHTARDTGMIDAPLINELERLGYDKGQLAKLKKDYDNAPQETQYENRAMFGMALTDHLNEIGWQGRRDWKPHEVQAVGWMGMMNNFSKVGNADDVGSALEQNLRRVSYELSPGEGSPWASKYGERFESLTPDEQIALTETVTARATEIAADVAGIDIRGIVHGTGGWENFQNPATVLQSLSSPKSAQIAANTLGYLLNQTEVWVNSLKSTTKNPKAFAVDFIEDGSENLGTNDGLKSFWELVMSNDPTGLIVGYQPIKTVDGQVGVRVLIDKGGAKRREAIEAAISGPLTGAVKGLDYKVQVWGSEASIYKATNDWTEVADGRTYLERLENLGVRRTTAGWDSLRSELEKVLDDGLGQAEESAPSGPGQQ